MTWDTLLGANFPCFCFGIALSPILKTKNWFRGLSFTWWKKHHLYTLPFHRVIRLNTLFYFPLRKFSFNFERHLNPMFEVTCYLALPANFWSFSQITLNISPEGVSEQNLGGPIVVLLDEIMNLSITSLNAAWIITSFPIFLYLIEEDFFKLSTWDGG